MLARICDKAVHGPPWNLIGTGDRRSTSQSRIQNSKSKIVVVLFFTASATFAADDASVGILFDNPHVDLGRIEAAGTIQQDFPFHIVGDAPVEILDVRPSCGCLHPALSKRVYAPGESDVLRFAVHATSQQNGKRRFQVTLNTRQGARLDTIPVVLEMDLHKLVEVQPSNLLLYVRGASPIHQTLQIKAPPTIQIVKVQSSSEQLDLDSIVKSREDPNLKQVSLTVHGEFPAGRTEEWVTIQTSGAKEETLVVPVTIVRPTRVRVVPDKLTTNRTVLGNRPAKWQVLLADAKSEPIRIEAATCADPRVRIDWPKDRTTRCRLIVELTPLPAEVPFETEVMLKIAEPVAVTLSIPLRVD